MQKKTIDKKPAEVGSTEKRKRGRPRKNGMKSAEALGIELWGMHLFHQERGKKEKYESALRMAARKNGTSATAIKRSLAEYQPKDAKFGLVMADSPPSLPAEKAELYRLLGLPEAFWRNPRPIPFGIRRIPRYRRSNAGDKS